MGDSDQMHGQVNKNKSSLRININFKKVINYLKKKFSMKQMMKIKNK